MTVKNVVTSTACRLTSRDRTQARINSVPTPETKTWSNALPLPEVTIATPMR